MEALRARVLSRQLKVAALPSSRELRNLFARDDNQGPRSPSLRSTAPPSTIAMVSISRSIPTTTPRAAPPHYQSFLTPILHRRFVWSCSVGFCVCYIEAFLISSKSSFFWSLFPLSWTGLKTLTLFFCTTLPILILRVSQLHVGTRANPSGFHTLKRSAGSFGTYSTLFTYVFASLVFILLYLWSGTKSDLLSFIIEGKSYERPRLNERFLYLVYFATHVGFVQGILHIAQDRGRLDLPMDNVPPKVAFKKQAPNIFSRAFFLAFVTFFTGPISYIFVRSGIWHYTLMVARTVFWLNRSSVLPAWPVGGGMFLRSAWIAFLLGCTWESAHAAFNIYFAQEPIKDGKTISEKSPDPNGTLVSGLKSPGLLTQVMAFAELVFISHNSPARRKSIFTDIDRKPTIWEQILKECLVVIGDVDVKLAEIGKPAIAPTPKAAYTPTTALVSLQNSPPAIPFSSDTALLTAATSSGRKFIDSIQSKDGASPSLNSVIAKLPVQPPSLAEAEATVTGTFRSKIETYLASPYGKPFRQTVQQTTSMLMPNVAIQVDAVSALTRLVTASLTEDEYGVVQNHVPVILQSFSSTIDALEKYIANPPIHWTDIEAKGKKPLVLREPDVLLKTLKRGLQDIAIAFKPYVKDMELSGEDRRRVLEAKEATLL